MKQYFQLIDGRIISSTNLEILPEDIEKQLKDKQFFDDWALEIHLDSKLEGNFSIINVTKLEV